MNASFGALMPMLCVLLAGLATMAVESFRAPGRRLPVGGLGVVGLLGTLVTTVLLWNQNAQGFGVIRADNFALFVTGTVAIVGLLTILFSSQVIDRDGLPVGEYYTLVLFSIVGMIMMAMANDLLIVFVALEIMSLAVYVLTGIRRDSMPGTEGAFKYFLLGAFSSAFFLYGIAFTYGVTGSTRLDVVGLALATQANLDNPLSLLALGLLLVGFAFKVSAVPFHMWAPDAYQGAPSVVTGFMATGVKAAAFAALVRVVAVAFESHSADWVPLVWVLAFATMILGTVVGVVQSNVKRMLAYSSIAHGGYLLVGLVAANDVAQGAILFYLLAYAVTNVAAFGVIALLGARDGERADIKDFAGLSHTRPAVAAMMTVCLLSLGGLPPTAGFIGKWYIFSAAVSAGFYGLAIVGVLSSVISVFFYLRIVVNMYMVEGEAGSEPVVVPGAGVAVLALATVAIFYLGVLPTRVLDLAAASLATIF